MVLEVSKPSPTPVLGRRVIIGGEHSGIGYKFTYVQVTFRKASLPPGMVRWRVLKALNAFACLRRLAEKHWGEGGGGATPSPWMALMPAAPAVAS